MLSFFKGVHCSSKNLLKIQLQTYHLPKEVEIGDFFTFYKVLLVLTNTFLLVIKDYLTFY